MTQKTKEQQLAIRHPDGTVASKAAQERLNSAVASTFASPTGKKTLAWLEQITLKHVFEAYDHEGKREVTNSELWQQEGMRKVFALIRSRIDEHQKTQKGKS